MGIDAEMFFVTSDEVNEAVLRSKSRLLCGAIGADAFDIVRPHVFSWIAARHALCLTHDDDMEAEWLRIHRGQLLPIVRVNLRGRYYGIGYERGMIHEYVAIAEWLERNFSNCVVYYGGDCSDALEVFNAGYRSVLIDHLASDLGRAYFESPFGAGDGGMPDPSCDMCDHVMTRCGAGRDFGMWSCFCGLRVQTRDGGKTMTEIDVGRSRPWPPRAGDEWVATR